VRVSIDDNSATRSFFKKFSHAAELVKANIQHELPEIMRKRPHKIKAAWGEKHQGQTILEYKVTTKQQNFRAAYIQNGFEIKVIFISEVLLKRDFVKLLAATHLVD
jgi:hypothetical protein